MSTNSSIEWTDATWNPVTGCSKVSAGCTNCYAEKLSHRFGWTEKPWNAAYAAENVKLHPERLEQPMSWRKPRRVFVNSMSDLFHEQVPFEFITKVFDIMAHTPEHTYQVLTKRPERMKQFVNQYNPENLAPGVLTNVWLGVSAENQQAADERIPLLLQTPASVRFLSCEPLLGPVILPPFCGDSAHRHIGKCSLYGNIHWVIVGGESGPNARPMHPDWVRDLRDQCTGAGVAFFFKQWGEWGLGRRMQEIEVPGFLENAREGIITLTTIDPPADAGKQSYVAVDKEGIAFEMVRFGKKKAGRILNGRTWDEFPVMS